MTSYEYVKYVVLVSIFLQVAADTSHSDCLNKPPFKSVSIGNCTAEPCELKSGTTVEFNLKILIRGNVNSMKVGIKAYAIGATVDYPVANDDVCYGLTDAECPLDDGEVVNYRLLFLVQESFPAVPCIATVTVTSDVGVQGCMTASLQVVK